MNKITIKDITFGELEEYVKKDCQFSNGTMRIEILGKNATGWEAIAGATTNSTREVVLQGLSSRVLEQEIEVDFKTKSDEIQQLKTELEVYKRALYIANRDWDEIFVTRMKELDMYNLPYDEEKEKLNKRALNDKKLEQIKQARKELDDESK